MSFQAHMAMCGSIPLYTWLGWTYSGGRMCADPVPRTVGWVTRKTQWFDRPKSDDLDREIHELKDRLYTALKLMKEEYISPERQAKMDAVREEYIAKIDQLEKDRREDKIGWWSYQKQKGNAKDEFEEKMEALEIKKITRWYAKLRWKTMVVDLWRSWFLAYRYTFNYRKRLLTEYVEYVEKIVE